MDLETKQTLVMIPNLEIEIWNRDGKTIDIIKTHNIIHSVGLNSFRNLIGYPHLQPGGTGYTPEYIAIGSDGTTPALSHTALFTEVFRKNITSRFAQGDDRLHWQLRVETTEANGGGTQALRECAIYSVPTGGVAWMRAIHTLINKSSAIGVTYNWRLTLANA